MNFNHGNSKLNVELIRQAIAQIEDTSKIKQERWLCQSFLDALQTTNA
ncbi:MAG: hypothetical protein V7K45_15815 [Nostoc sp.]